MPDQLSIRYLYYDAKKQLMAEVSEVEVAVGASMFKLRDAIASKLRDYGLSATELLTMTLWRPNAELLTRDEKKKAKDVLTKRIKEAKGRLDAVAREMEDDERVNELIDNGVEQRNNLVHVIVAVNLPTLEEFLQAQRIKDLIGSEQRARFYVNKLRRFDLRDLLIPENKISFPHDRDGTIVTVRLSNPNEIDNAPIFVKNLIKSLKRKRIIPSELVSTDDYRILSQAIGTDALNDYFESGSLNNVNQQQQELLTYRLAVTECAPLITYIKSKSSFYKDQHFTGYLVDRILANVDGVLYNKSVEAMPSMLVSDRSPKNSYTYKPKSDFMLSTASALSDKSALPLILGECVSDPENETDRARMLLQAAVYVRVGNHFRGDKAFVQLCIYLNKNLGVERYLVYQDDRSNNDAVTILHDAIFKLAEPREAMQFALQLYNYRQHELQSLIDGFDNEMDANLQALSEAMKDLGLGSLSSASKQSTAISTKKSSRQGSSMGTITEHTTALQLRGYCIRATIGNHPHVARVWKPDQDEEFMVKLVKRDSTEVVLLRYLNSPELRSDPRNHTIPVVEIIDASADLCILVMPKFEFYPLLVDRRNLDALHDYVRQIVEGVAFLHEHNISHLDLKPTNIVVDVSTQKVYIIDFGLARRLQYEDAQISGYVGTEDWTAPEVGEHRYSPIRADCWAAGKLIQDTFKLCGPLGPERKHLNKIAIRLLDQDPGQRPALKDLLNVRRTDEHDDALYPKDSMLFTHSLRPTIPLPQLTTVMVA
ncbi:kinase-like protein [Wolfiporia cocos MD-104 SS10]|uniref:Kinase-like protein n=1 Tax=Wolfiporia cocos (strain MD-104) TaxID=742152 RepID=A0A2H3J5U4_WOLCO|nr:kinase-like protein [Wolfiporia cocos MD-104 SS10]